MREISILRWFDRKFEKWFIILAAVAAAGLIGYCNSFTVPFILDDFGSISNNYAIHNFLDIAALWKFYANRIVLYFTLSVNYFIHDNGVEGYHITNLLIHILNGYLIFLIFNSLLSLKYFEGKLLSNYRRVIAAAAAILFVVHPIQVNAVTYIVQRTASLAGTFYFLAVYFFILYRTHDKARHYLLMMLFTIIAMFTKENTITIPFMLLLIELLFFMKDGKTSWKKRILIFIPILLTIPIIPGTNLLLKGYSQSDPKVDFKASTSMDRFEYFYTELNVILLYIRLMFIPDKQNFDYSNDVPVWGTTSKTIWENYSYVALILLVLMLIFALYTLKRNRLVGFGILWFFGGLAVESSFISIKDVYFEHRLYFPCAGFIMFLFGMIFYERKKPGSLRHRHLLRRPILMFLIIVPILTLTYTGLTLKRNYIYSDSIRLWADVVSKAPNSDRAHCVLATGYLNAYDEKKNNLEMLDKAEDEFKKSIELYKRNSTAHCNLSKVYLLKGDYDKSIEEARVTLGITDSEYAYHNMGSAYKKQGKIKEALDAFKKGYKIDNKSSFIIKALANTYYEEKDYKNADFYLKEQLKYDRFANKKEINEKLDEIKIKLKMTCNCRAEK